MRSPTNAGFDSSPFERIASPGAGAEPAERLRELLLSAADRQDLNELRSMLASSSLELPAVERQRALLSKTIERGFSPGALTLIDHGVVLGQPDPSGSSPLFMAARIGDVLVCQALIERGVKPDEPSMHGASALSEAARSGHLDVCAFLLQSGADPNAMTKLQRTPLHKAAQGMSLECCKMLVASGSDPGFIPPGKLSPRYLTPFQYAVGYSSTSVASYFIDSSPELLSSTTPNGTSMDELASDENRPLVRAGLTARAIGNSLSQGLTEGGTAKNFIGFSPI
jgi:ankyrin repeat protein